MINIKIKTADFFINIVFQCFPKYLDFTFSKWLPRLKNNKRTSQNKGTKLIH